MLKEPIAVNKVTHSSHLTSIGWPEWRGLFGFPLYIVPPLVATNAADYRVEYMFPLSRISRALLPVIVACIS